MWGTYILSLNKTIYLVSLQKKVKLQAGTADGNQSINESQFMWNVLCCVSFREGYITSVTNFTWAKSSKCFLIFWD